jgi:hypothetical protein
MRTPSVIAASLALMLVLAACATPTEPVDTSFTVSGTAYADQFDPGLVPLGVSLFLFRDDAFPAAVQTNSFIAVNDDIFVSPISPVADDGSFELVFPDGDDVPASTLAAAADFVVNARDIPTCSVVASDATANVTTAAWEFASVPGIVMYLLEGAALTIISSEPIDFDDPDLTVFDLEFVTWVYADSAVDVSTGAGCDTGTFEVIVDVSLQAGWNQLEWALTEGAGTDPDVLRLRNSVADDVHAYIAFGFF